MLKVSTFCSEEIWNDINGYEGLYQVSSLGTIKSLARFTPNQWSETSRFREEKQLSYQLTKDGYPTIKLSKNGNAIRYRIHRLVALCFLENPFGKEQVNHINGIKTDNRVENLEWATYSENSKHSFDNNLQNPRKGVENNKSKLTEQQVFEIRNYKGIFNTYELGIMYGVCNTTIGSILKRKTWKHI